MSLQPNVSSAMKAWPRKMKELGYFRTNSSRTHRLRRQCGSRSIARQDLSFRRRWDDVGGILRVRCAMNHRIGIFHADAVRTAVFLG